MCASTTKKRRAPPSQTPVSTSQPIVTNSLLDSFDFLTPNEYSEKTIGIQAFLLRKSVGDINFSDIIDDSEKRNRQGQTPSFSAILEDKRRNLSEIDASVEKCLMLNRLIHYIKENEALFTSLISDIRIAMQLNMADNQNGQNPTDFRQREQDFNIRKTAQEIRRLFYHSNDEAKNPKNLVYLQNRTTEQLSYITTQMSRDSKSRQTYNKELENILQTSFMIVAQPHSGVNPVTIYDRRGPGEYTAKISVTIISLLHDFMQAQPGLIELYDIEPSLCPPSQYYKLEEPRSLSWKTCQLQTPQGGKSRSFLYAELTTITIEQSSKTDTRVRFAQLLHSFKFAIKLQFNLAENHKTPVYQFALESLQFGIGAHNNQIPQLLTRVILDDIRRFSKIQPADVKVIQMYMQRYFIHRTGVKANDCVNIYLEQELIRATNQRSNNNSLEDIYLDFLVSFVHQVEFMSKHPILAMFHADGLFLGICNSERAAEAIVQSSIPGSPVIGLRFNSIRVDYNASTMTTTLPRTIKFAPCAVRVDIYNDRTKKLQNRTFDSTILANDISKFVLTAETDSASRIRILSNFDDRVNGKSYMSFKEFAKYHHPRLQEISKSDEKYKLVTDLVENANDGNTEEDDLDNLTQNSDLFPFSPNSVASLPPVTPSLFENDYSTETNSHHEYMSIPYDGSNHNVASPQNILSPPDRSQQQQQQPQQIPYVNNQDAILKHLLSRPEIVEQVIRQYGNGVVNPSAPIEPSQQMVQQPQVQYHVQPVPYHQQIPMQIPQPRQSPQVPYQQPPLQTTFQQPQTQLYQSSPMQFQPSVPQQQQPYFPQHQQQVLFQQQQKPTLPSVIHYLPTNINQSTSLTQQTSQFPPVFQTNVNDNVTQPILEQIQGWNITDGNSNSTITNSIQSQIPTDQTSMTIIDQYVQQYLEELTNSNSTEINN